MGSVKCFIPFFVWLNTGISNDMDVCKFYPKFAQKGSHSENIRDTTCHCIFNYFQSNCFVFKTPKAITSYVGLAFRQRLWLVFGFQYGRLNVDQALSLKAKRSLCSCRPWEEQTQPCIHVSGKIMYSCIHFLSFEKKRTSLTLSSCWQFL